MSAPQGMLFCCRFQKTFSSLHKILVVHCCCERGRNHLVCGCKGIINSAIDQTKNGDFYLNGLPLLQTELPAIYSSALFQQFCNLFGKVCFAVSENFQGNRPQNRHFRSTEKVIFSCKVQLSYTSQ